MSAFSHTDWTVLCDHPDCLRCLRSSDFMQDVDTAWIRRALKQQGWTVAIRQSQADGSQREKRLDYCPDHKPEGS